MQKQKSAMGGVALFHDCSYSDFESSMKGEIFSRCCSSGMPRNVCFP